MSKYAELRDEYYGGYAYDFSPGPLNMLSEGLARGGKMEDGLTIQLKNAEYHPDAHYVQFTLGQFYQRMDQKDKAVGHYKKAIELAPDNDFYKRALKQFEES